jgi:hypothetical protein
MRCDARMALIILRRPIWKHEAVLNAGHARGPLAPPVHMIKLTLEREITPYVWVHPDDDR